MLKPCLKIILIFALIFGPQYQVMAQDTNLDSILSGFDDEETGKESAIEFEDVLSAFDDDQVVEDTDLSESTQTGDLPEWLRLSGGLGLSASYNFAHKAPLPGLTDQRGLSRLRTSLDLQADLKLTKGWQARVAGKSFYDSIFSMRGRDDYTTQALDEYEDEREITELYLQGMLLPNLDLKAGRQIVVWGKSDNIRVTDILNPLDNREPGVVDIRDLRQPLAMSKLDYYLGKWGLSAMMIHEIRFNKDPVFGNDFFVQGSPQPLEVKPSTSFDNQEYALAANGIFTGWDISFYGARIFDEQAHRVTSSTGPHLEHSRISMLGSAINVACGNWLIKGESALLADLEYSVDVGKKDRLDLLIGAEYNGINETVLSLELVNRHIFSFDERLKQAPVYGQENEFQSVLRCNRDFLNDTLQLTLLISTFGVNGGDGSFQRFSGQYDWSDSVSLSGGIIVYQNGNKTLFRNIDDNDRIFSELRYSF